MELDLDEAARWLREAVARGDPDAPLLLGMMYADFEADMDEDPDAESRLEVAAAAGYTSARYMLGALRGDDESFEPDEEELRELAEVTLQEAWRGDPDAQSRGGHAGSPRGAEQPGRGVLRGKGRGAGRR